jgi:hypothetical protein
MIWPAFPPKARIVERASSALKQIMSMTTS